eukprot:TRINITY_DN108396_c0_g1_i1.p1 TRINITY_DN108396_c0_g1~~TRINITY_DN108396_c0_g1_i1.p1  ORF type:complete len:136 (-),score=22.53 TRINITY_DN108396_c0_g1_i1:65-451(-)
MFDGTPVDTWLQLPVVQGQRAAKHQEHKDHHKPVSNPLQNSAANYSLVVPMYYVHMVPVSCWTAMENKRGQLPKTNANLDACPDEVAAAALRQDQLLLQNKKTKNFYRNKIHTKRTRAKAWGRDSALK